MKNDGGPAFPKAADLVNADFPYDEARWNAALESSGMSLRDKFAETALPYCLAHDCPPAWVRGSQEHRQQAVAEAYLIADAMIQERRK